MTSYDAKTEMMLSQQETLALCSLHGFILTGVKSMWMPSYVFHTTKLHFDLNELK